MKQSTLLIFLIIIMTQFACKKGQDKVVFLQNNEIKAGFLPDVGGRMIFFSKNGASNFLYSDETLWNEPENERMKPAADAPNKAYNGLITWVGPQSEWWNHQDLIPEKQGDVWPPDPWIIYGNYTIIEQSATKLVMEGEESPITGLKMKKSFELVGNKLHISVTATNIRDTEVSWDLWSNARFTPFTQFEIGVDSTGILNVDAKENDEVDKVDYELKDGLFVFHPEMPSEGKSQRIAKAYLYPNEGKIVAKKENAKLTIEFEKIPQKLIHPEQALIEVYNCISVDGASDILELEHHAAYKTLQAGESMSLTEVWTMSR